MTLAVVLVGWLTLARPATAGVTDEGPGCSLVQAGTLLRVDVTDMTDTEVRTHLAGAMALGGMVLRSAGSAALDGSIDDVRTFLASGWQTPYGHDLRMRVAAIMDVGGPQVRADANAALDAGTLEALEQFLTTYDCQPDDVPTPSTPSGPTTTAPETATDTATDDGVTPPPARAVPGVPAFAG